MVKSVLSEGALTMSNVEERQVAEGSICEKGLVVKIELHLGF